MSVPQTADHKVYAWCILLHSALLFNEVKIPHRSLLRLHYSDEKLYTIVFIAVYNVLYISFYLFH